MSDDPIWTSSVSLSQSNDTRPSPRVIQRVPAPRPRRPIGLYLLTGCLAAIVLMCVMTSLVLASIGPTTLLSLRDRWLGRSVGETIATIGQVAQVIVTHNDVWPVPNNGRLTVLLMGIDSRPNQKGEATRSDVITLVTIDPISNTAAILSMPRDLYVPLPGYNLQDRINTAYFWGEVNRLPGGGPAYAIKTIEYNFGIPIQRYGVIDFDGFKKVIDTIGGIDIDVPHEIIDNEYPTEDYGIERLVIPAGHIHMDGDLALKYVRTRHQDSDLGRNERQLQVLLAIRDKALSIGSINTVPAALNAIGDSLKTDFTLPELLTLAKKWAAIPRENIHTYGIDMTMITAYVTPDGAQVLLPNRELIGAVVAQFLGQK
jgi:LCP family protein required for cell wall assembly